MKHDEKFEERGAFDHFFGSKFGDFSEKDFAEKVFKKWPSSAANRETAMAKFKIQLFLRLQPTNWTQERRENDSDKKIDQRKIYFLIPYLKKISVIFSMIIEGTKSEKMQPMQHRCIFKQTI